MAKKISNLVFVILIALLIWQKVPIWIRHYRQEGTKAHELTVFSLEESLPIHLPVLDEPHLLIFWATWCGPCQIELSRINQLIASNKIPANRVIAISSNEELSTIRQHVREKKYLFQIAIDSDLSAIKAYQVQGTPTLVLINKKGEIDWVTMGLSPLLELRLIQALTGTQEEGDIL